MLVVAIASISIVSGSAFGESRERKPKKIDLDSSVVPRLAPTALPESTNIFVTSDLGFRIYNFQNHKSLWVSQATAFPSVGISFALDKKWILQTQYAYHLSTYYELPPTNVLMIENQQKNNFLLGMVYRFG